MACGLWAPDRHFLPGTGVLRDRFLFFVVRHLFASALTVSGIWCVVFTEKTILLKIDGCNKKTAPGRGFLG
jgi:hypothetical protein